MKHVEGWEYVKERARREYKFRQMFLYEAKSTVIEMAIAAVIITTLFVLAVGLRSILGVL